MKFNKNSSDNWDNCLLNSRHVVFRNRLSSSFQHEETCKTVESRSRWRRQKGREKREAANVSVDHSSFQKSAKRNEWRRLVRWFCGRSSSWRLDSFLRVNRALVDGWNIIRRRERETYGEGAFPELSINRLAIRICEFLI